MKKFVITFTLIVSSFFFLFTDVKAASTFDITIDNFDVLKSEDFLNFQNAVSEYLENNPQYVYYVFVSSSTVYVYPEGFDLYSCNNFTTYVICNFFHQARVLSWSNGKLLTGSTSSNGNFNLMSNFYFLYTNMKFVFDGGNQADILNIHYLDNLIKITYGDTIPSLYDLSLIYDNPIKEDHKEQIEILTNFYTVSIEKIEYLVEKIISNYVYLSIIVIFILIFIMKLIFRRSRL